MKTTYLVSLMTALVLLSVLQFSGVLAGSLDVSVDSVTIKGIELTSTDTREIVGFAGEVVPLRVIFKSGGNMSESDARVKAWISGYREDIAKSTRRIHLLDDRIYSELLSLKLPSDIDPEEEYTLYVRIETKTDNKEVEYTLRIQRESYNVEILDIDFDRTVSAGSSLAIDVVLKNRGFEELEDVFIVASIPELGLQRKAYFEDLTPEDDADEDKRDSAERRAYLKIPVNTEAGVYELRVEAYNSDSRDVVTRDIAISGAEQESKVIVPVASKEVGVGSTTSYDLILVNSGSKIGVYEIIPETAEGVIVSVDRPVITVQAGQSEIVRVNVKAGDRYGTYSFSLNVNSDNELVKRVTLSAVISKRAIGAGITGGAAVLAIVLAIIFIVLVIVLIVLLTRKPEKPEELEESYY